MAVAVPPFPIAQFSVEQYHRMIESGAFNEDDRLELIEGWVVRKMAKGPEHEYCVGQLEDSIRMILPAGWHVRNQAPITLSFSEPEPDLTIVRGARADCRDRHPHAGDVAVVIEVSDTTLATDRLKARTYAAAGIAEYWIVNVEARCVEIHRAPVADHPDSPSAQQQVLPVNTTIPVTIEGNPCGSIAIANLFP
ncbi:MAG TPA: Uma2 family endonuclease [Polyangiaceae bacterium]